MREYAKYVSGNPFYALGKKKIVNIRVLLHSHVEDHLRWHLLKHLIESQFHAGILR